MTTTMSYRGHLAPGWNAKNPQWFVVGSDTQYPRVINSDGSEGLDPTLSQSGLQLVLGDIGDFRASQPLPVPVAINGDLTDFGHGSERVPTQEFFKKLEPSRGAPLFLPLLGNHDYGNNVNDCANNGCARDSVCDVLKWTRELEPRSWDYHLGENEHRGSYGYAVDVGPAATLIQLNDYPTYQRWFESGDLLTKSTFNVLPSLRWLEGALRDARERNRYVFINMHRRGGWTGSGHERFRELIESYGVQAVFAGHLHKELGLAGGTAEYFGRVPVFQTGALLNRTYLIVEFRPDLGRFTVYKVASDQGHRAKQKVGDYSLALSPGLPAADFSDAALTLHEGNNASQKVLCELKLPYAAFNLPGAQGCTNDEARSLRILKAKKGTMIRLFGNWHHTKDQGYAFIYVTKDILLPEVVGSFDHNQVTDRWEIVRLGGHTLDGKVSSMSMLSDAGVPPERVEFYSGNDGGGDLLCAVALPYPAHNLPGASGCKNDQIRSMKIIKAKKGTMIRLFGNWHHQQDQGYAFVYALQDIVKPVTVGTFERNQVKPEWEIARMGGGTLDGKVSSISMQLDSGESESRAEFFEGNNATQSLLCTVPLPFTAFNLPGRWSCDNDEIRSVRIVKAKKGMMIRVFGNWHHQKDQGYTFITVRRDIWNPVTVGSFDRSYTNDSVKVENFGSDVLDGKISSMSVHLDMPVDLKATAPAMADP